MHCPPEAYQLEQALAEHLPSLRPAQRRGLAFWVFGTILARSACQNAVIAILLHFGQWHTVRQRLRGWVQNGPDAYHTQVATEVTLCFAPLLRWIVSWWQGEQLALALDATYHGDRAVALVVSVLYRGCALPVAWHVQPVRHTERWLPQERRLLRLLGPAIPTHWTVLVLTDRGLWSPTLWSDLRKLGWHPLMRVRGETTFAPAGATRVPARHLVAGPGYAWVGRGVAFKPGRHQAGTLLVVWEAEQDEPWIILTDLPPEQIGVGWYGLRMWIELGFKALKGVGWNWEKTRRTDPTRVARHWLVVAVAMLWVLAYGTRAEDAEALGRDPVYLRVPPDLNLLLPTRHLSLFLRGRSLLAWLLPRRRCWTRLWLRPAPWPSPAPTLQITIHSP